MLEEKVLIEMKMKKNNDTLIDFLAETMHEIEYPGINKVLNVMRKIDRGLFIETAYKKFEGVYEDVPVHIGFEQTCSQPRVVAEMALSLELKKGMKVLEIGTGSGYSSSVASMLIGSSGRLVSMEIEPELAIIAQKNLINFYGEKKFFERIVLITGSGFNGYELRAPYDRIYFTAGINDIANIDLYRLKKQLKDGGIMLIPEQDGPVHKYRLMNGDLNHQEISSYRFVPLRK